MNLDISHPQSLKRQTALKALVWSRKRNWNEEGKKGWLIWNCTYAHRGHWLPFRLGSLILVARTETHPSSDWHSLSQTMTSRNSRKMLVDLLEEVFKCSEPIALPSLLTWCLKQPSSCLHAIILTENTFAYFGVWALWLRPSSRPLLGSGVGGSDNPWLVCGGWGSSYSPFPVFLWMLSSGWVGSKHFQKFSTARLFPQLFCLSCVERSQQNCGWRRESWEKYSTGISHVGCAERSCVLNDQSVRLNTPWKRLVVRFLLPGPGQGDGCRDLPGSPSLAAPSGWAGLRGLDLWAPVSPASSFWGHMWWGRNRIICHSWVI